MSWGMPRQLDRSGSGRIISFWMQFHLVEKLGRMAKQRGVTRNKVLNEIVEAAEEI